MTEALVEAARGSDLFTCEAYFFDNRISEGSFNRYRVRVCVSPPCCLDCHGPTALPSSQS